jgi:hypothetical protein
MSNCRGTVPSGPEIGDPVVVDGMKYRLRHIADGTGLAKTSFGGWQCVVQIADLVWDRVADVWRVKL